MRYASAYTFYGNTAVIQQTERKPLANREGYGSPGRRYINSAFPARRRIHVSKPAGETAKRKNEFPRKSTAPDLEGTSRLSPHLHFGEISARACWHRITPSGKPEAKKGAESFLRQLVWAGVLPAPTLPLADISGEIVPEGVQSFSVGKERKGSRSLAAQTDGLPDSRRRNARTLGHGMDA